MKYKYLTLLPHGTNGRTYDSSYAFLFCRFDEKTDEVEQAQTYLVEADKLPPKLEIMDIVVPEKVYQEGGGDWVMSFKPVDNNQRIERLDYWNDIAERLRYVRELR